MFDKATCNVLKGGRNLEYNMQMIISYEKLKLPVRTRAWILRSRLNFLGLQEKLPLD